MLTKLVLMKNGNVVRKIVVRNDLMNQKAIAASPEMFFPVTDKKMQNYWEIVLPLI